MILVVIDLILLFVISKLLPFLLSYFQLISLYYLLNWIVPDLNHVLYNV